MEVIIGTIVGIIVAFLGMYCYRRGVKDTQHTKKGEEPKKLKIPKPKTKTEKESIKKSAKLANELDILLNFQPEITGYNEVTGDTNA